MGWSKLDKSAMLLPLYNCRAQDWFWAAGNQGFLSQSIVLDGTNGAKFKTAVE